MFELCASMGRACHRRWIGLLVAVLIALAGCAAQRAASDSSDSPKAADSSPISREDLPPPPLLRNARIEKLTGPAVQRAQLDPAAALATLTQPEYLAQTPQPVVDADEFDEPAIESLRLYAQAMEEFGDGQWRAALESLEKAIELDPDSAEPRVLLAQIYMQIREAQRAQQALADALGRDSQHPLALFFMGRYQFEQGKWDQAAVLLYRMTQIKDRAVDPGVRYLTDYYLGQSLVRLGMDTAAQGVLESYLLEPEDFTRSTRYYREVMLVGRQRAAVQVQLGDSHCRLGAYETALKYYETAAQSGRIQPSQMATRLAYVYLILGQTELAHREAVALLGGEDVQSLDALLDYVAEHSPDRKALAALVDEGYAQNRTQELALASMRLKDDKAAVAFAKADLALDASHFEVFGQMLKRLGPDRLDQAVGATIELIEKNPTYASQMVGLLSELTADTQAWDKAIESQPRGIADGPGGWHLRGMVAFRGGLLDKADEYFNRALDRSPDYIPAQIAMIEVLLKRAERAGAEEQTRIYQDAARRIEAMDVQSHPQLRLLYVEALRGLGQYREALASVEQMLAERPGHTQLTLSKAELQRSLRDFAAAEITLLQLLRAEPRNEEAYRQLFHIYERESRSDAKFLQLNRSLQDRMGLSVLAQLKQTRLLLLQGDTQKATGILDELIKQDVGTHEEDLAELVMLLGQVDRWSDAAAVLERTLDADAKNQAAVGLLRQVASVLDQPERFYVRYETFLQAQPQSIGALLELTELYAVWDKLPQAIDAMSKAVAMNPPSVEYYHDQLARLQSQAGQHDQALLTIDKALVISPDSPLFITTRGWLLKEADRNADAEAWMLKSIGEHPAIAEDLRISLAQLYGAMDRVDDAIKQIDEVIKAQPLRSAELYYLQTSLLHGKPGSEKVVERLLQKVLAIDADHAGANNDLGYFWADASRNLARAEQMVRKAVASSPNIAAYLDSLGWVLYKRGNTAEAVVWLERARRAPGGDDPVILDHLADAYWQSGQKETAVKLWREAQTGAMEAEPDRAGTYSKLLPLLQSKLKAVSENKVPQVAPIPVSPVEDVAPELPSPGVQ